MIAKASKASCEAKANRCPVRETRTPAIGTALMPFFPTSAPSPPIIAAPTASGVAWRAKIPRRIAPRASPARGRSCRALRAIRSRSSGWRGPDRPVRSSGDEFPALAPTSMPRVGSSRMSSFGLLASHLPRTIFCWLPPDNLPTIWSSELVLTLNRATPSLASASSAARSMKPSARHSRKRGKREIVADAHWPHQALRAAILRHIGDAQRARFAGRADAHRLAAEQDLPGVRRRHAENCLREFASARADQTGEADDFAGAHGQRNAARHRSSHEIAHLEHWRANSAAIFGNRLSIRRPTIIERVRRRTSPQPDAVPTCAPSRSTVTRSASAKISSMRWLM